jgi:hypothetical protein
MNVTGRPRHVVVQHLSQRWLIGQMRVINGLIKTGNEARREIVIGTGTRVNRQHRGVPAERRVRCGTAEHLTEISGESSKVLGMTLMGERMIEHRVGETSIVER